MVDDMRFSPEMCNLFFLLLVISLGCMLASDDINTNSDDTSESENVVPNEAANTISSESHDSSNQDQNEINQFQNMQHGEQTSAENVKLDTDHMESHDDKSVNNKKSKNMWDYINNLGGNLWDEFLRTGGFMEDLETDDETKDVVEMSLVEPEKIDTDVDHSAGLEEDKISHINDSDNDIPNIVMDVNHNNIANEIDLDIFANNTQGINNEKENNDTESTKYSCIGKNLTENDTASVKIVNGSMLLTMIRYGQWKNKSMEGACVLALFYAPWCPFCAKIAPQYNALGRAFPQLDILAVNAMDFSYLNVQFGTVAVPHIILFRNSRPVLRYNNTVKSYDALLSFIVNMTGLQPNSSINVTEMDYIGPLPGIVTREMDYLLILAWIFVVICTFYIVTVSHVGQRMIDQVRILWHEHQHEHRHIE